MAKADKYATADFATRIKVSATVKTARQPATSKPAGDNRGGQNNKRKADHLDSRPRRKQVANMKEEPPVAQAGAQRQRACKNAWQPKLTIEQMLDAPCKMHSEAKPATHTLWYCSFAQRLSRGEGLSAPLGAAPQGPAPAPGLAPAQPPPNDGRLHDHFPEKDGAYVVFTSEGDDKHNQKQRRHEWVL
ncbi:hypothetical protein D1007_15663 [Hordeum vulgare]|nr:hypothetical protein D1007_15663 [Hordeum vulgare]